MSITAGKKADLPKIKNPILKHIATNYSHAVAKNSFEGAKCARSIANSFFKEEYHYAKKVEKNMFLCHYDILKARFTMFICVKIVEYQA